ncbi:MAG: CHC2 zinc finger domain-containing protein [Planctomycetota bacterium]|jgi:DNA primase
MPYIDFAELKARLPIEEAVPLLDLTVKLANGQLRGPCPTCRTGGPRALVITPAKSAFYCFGAKTGGDVIALAAHIRDCSIKDAAQFLAGEENSTSTSSRNGTSSPGTVPEERRKGNEGSPALKPLAYLDPGHPKVVALGLSAETCEGFGAGYAPKGIMRGRLAIPIHDWHGVLVAYCGRAVEGESPTLIFPNGFRPEEQLFNAQQVGEGEMVLARDPLDALLAAQNGVENVAALLTEALSAEQLQMIAALMDERRCETVEIL